MLHLKPELLLFTLTNPPPQTYAPLRTLLKGILLTSSWVLYKLKQNIPQGDVETLDRFSVLGDIPGLKPQGAGDVQGFRALWFVARRFLHDALHHQRQRGQVPGCCGLTQVVMALERQNQGRVGQHSIPYYLLRNPKISNICFVFFFFFFFFFFLIGACLSK